MAPFRMNGMNGASDFDAMKPDEEKALPEAAGQMEVRRRPRMWQSRSSPRLNRYDAGDTAASTKSTPASMPQASSLPMPPMTGTSRDLRQRTTSLRYAVASNNTRKAKEIMDQLREAGLLESGGFTILDASGNGLLQIAALNGHVDMVELLLRYSIDINNVDRNHGTALQAAIYLDQHKVTDVLLDRHPNVNTKGGFYGCALQVAAYRASEALVSRLLNSHGAQVDLFGGKYGYPLQAAVRTGQKSVVTPILNNPNTDVNAHGGKYETAIQAVARGPYRMRLYLRDISRGRILQHKARTLQGVVLRDSSKLDPDYVGVAQDLVAKGAIIDVQGGSLGNCINAAASSGMPDMLKLMLDHCRASGMNRAALLNPALLTAIIQPVGNHLELVKLLVENGAEVNCKRSVNIERHPLEAAASNGLLPVVKYLLSLKDKAGNQLVDINVESGIHGTALRAAIVARHEETANYLVENHAECGRDDEKYGNVLQLATFSGLQSAVENLLDTGCNPNIRDTAKRTSLHIAAWCGYPGITTLLVEKGANIYAKDTWGDLPLDQVQESLDRGDHPGATRKDLEAVKRILLDKMEKVHQETPGVVFRGARTKSEMEAESPVNKHLAKPVFTMAAWNPGLGFQAVVTDFLDVDGDEYVVCQQPLIDDILHYTGGIDEIMADYQGKPENAKRKLRWVHIPANNMTWAEMVISNIFDHTSEKPKYKNIWGTDPFYTSPDLAPHSRFITPQCGRLLPATSTFLGIPSEHLPEEHSQPLFMAMPYLNWEADRAQRGLSTKIETLRTESIKTETLQTSQSWISESSKSDTKTPPSAPIELPEPDNTDDELLRRYLFKRRPLHLRRTLDQYYYSYLADTKIRDGDQVVMRHRNQEVKQSRLDADQEYQYRKQIVDEHEAKIQRMSSERGANKSMTKDESLRLKISEDYISHVNHKSYRDGNSPVVMVDQLWLWVLDDQTLVTSFPRRRSDRDEEDLDIEDKTDILKSLLAYFHSQQRPEIDDAHDLTELIVSQCVGILHQPDMVPELDFLKIYSSESNVAADRVMTMLTQFVNKFENYMAWLETQGGESEDSIKQFERIFSVTDETHLLRNVQDIKDELGMLHAVFRDQRRVLEIAGEEFLRSTECKYNCSDRLLQGTNEKKLCSSCEQRRRSFIDQTDKQEKQVVRMQWQSNQAYETLKDLLDLKQQQANVLEARVSRNQAIDAGKQGKTILVFTIVTIIFLPLTFMTTIFTLPVAEFPRIAVPEGSDPDPVALLQSKLVFPIMFGITLVISVPLIVFAFKIDALEHYSESIVRVWKRMVESEVEKVPLKIPVPTWLRSEERLSKEAVRGLIDESD